MLKLKRPIGTHRDALRIVYFDSTGWAEIFREDMGRDLSRGKITASHLEEEMNTEFEMSVVSNISVSRSGPVRYQKPIKHFCGLCFGPLNPPSCSSRRRHFLRLQKSHPKEKQ